MATATLYKLTVSLDQDSNILLDEEYVRPRELAHVLTQLPEFEYANILAAVVRHCISSGIKLDEELKELIHKL